jgi:MbtH protein
MSEARASEEYVVVRNHDEQYSVWRADRDIPAGWAAVGKRGPMDDCLAYIEEVWTDIRPLSLKQKIEGSGGPTGHSGGHRRSGPVRHR